MRYPHERLGTGFLVVIALVLGTPCSAQWSAPVQVSRTSDGTCYPSLTVDSEQTLHATWTRGLPNYVDLIEYSCKPVGVDTWTIPVTVTRDSVGLRISIIVMGPGHQPHIFWGSEAVQGHVYVCHRSGDTWTIPKRLEAWNGTCTWPQACADRQGRIHAVWQMTDAHSVWYVRYEDTAWVALERIVSDTVETIGTPAVAADGDGFAHVVYAANDTTGAGYLHQTGTGWTSPVYLPSYYHSYGEGPRIALDTLEWPEVVWKEGGRYAVYCGWTGDSWGPPERLDSAEGDIPTVCVDSWNQVHVFFGEDRIGMRERVRHQGRWVASLLVDPHPGRGEPVVSRNRLSLLWEMANQPNPEWYSYRDLAPPGIDASEAQMPVEMPPAAPNPIDQGSAVEFMLSTPASATIDVFDSAGRLVNHLDLGLLEAGKHAFRPYPHLPCPGVYFCHIKTGFAVKVVKVVLAK